MSGERCCVQCGDAFVLDPTEARDFAERGLKAPRRCERCRADRKGPTPVSTAPAPRPARDPHEVLCSACGAATRLPFVPIDDRPVYCPSCFKLR